MCHTPKLLQNKERLVCILCVLLYVSNISYSYVRGRMDIFNLYKDYVILVCLKLQTSNHIHLLIAFTSLCYFSIYSPLVPNEPEVLELAYFCIELWLIKSQFEI